MLSRARNATKQFGAKISYPTHQLSDLIFTLIAHESKCTWIPPMEEAQTSVVSSFTGIFWACDGMRTDSPYYSHERDCEICLHVLWLVLMCCVWGVWGSGCECFVGALHSNIMARSTLKIKIHRYISCSTFEAGEDDRIKARKTFHDAQPMNQLGSCARLQFCLMLYSTSKITQK